MVLFFNLERCALLPDPDTAVIALGLTKHWQIGQQDVRDIFHGRTISANNRQWLAVDKAVTSYYITI